MAEYFNEAEWREAARQPDWYLRLEPHYKRLLESADESSAATRKEIKEEVRSFFENLLARDELNLSTSGPDWDEERQPVDTVVVHHTSEEPGMTKPRLNVIHLLNLYRPHYSHPPAKEEYIKGKGIYSNHFRDGEQVFWAYHWLIRNDGSSERLLYDREIGWQAGDWKVNCRSVAICFDDDLSHKRPTQRALETAGYIIKEYYPGSEVLGHREINPRTDCPGELFIKEWGARLKETK